ncbi:unnamed protein product [Amaranthus hypochondriacus]
MALNYALAFIFYLLLTSPYMFSGLRGEEMSNMNDEHVYEIDYRGPETHSHLPPPKTLDQKPHIHHHKLAKRSRNIASNNFYIHTNGN